VGAELARAIAPTNPTASNVLVTNMGCLLFLFVAVIQHATVSAGSYGTLTGFDRRSSTSSMIWTAYSRAAPSIGQEYAVFVIEAVRVTDDEAVTRHSVSAHLVLIRP